MQRGFVNIVTVFSSASDRSISQISKVYENRNGLKEKIRLAGKGFLDNPDVLAGKRILVKPNWVWHDHKPDDEICLRTHNEFLLAALEVICENKPSSVLIGDAPIQGCEWDKMIDPVFADKINEVCNIHSIPVSIKDFRRVTFDPDRNNPVYNRNEISNYAIFDLAEKSYLEPITNDHAGFRVTSYNPDKLAASHKQGRHLYCITRDLFESDIIISMPKLKTHQKTGITGALKNLVGLNGDKDFLPHHRMGGDQNGGDCYPGKNILRHQAEKALDNANRNQGKMIYWSWYYLSRIFWKISLPSQNHHLTAGWYGNDTCWRMVRDLNRVAMYGQIDGKLSDKPQREIYSLCDGVIGGQGEGPLYPDPLGLGIITFSNSSIINDRCAAIIMGFDPEKIPLLRLFESDLLAGAEYKIYLDGNEIKIPELKKISIPARPSSGWKDHLAELHA